MTGAVVYGPTWAIFNSMHGWTRNPAVDTTYNYWENYWAQQINQLIYGPGSTDLLTDTGDKQTAVNIITEMLVRTNEFLNKSAKGDGGADVYGKDGFPRLSVKQEALIRSLAFEEGDLEVIETFTTSGFGKNSDK